MSKLNLSNFAKNISAKLGANAPGITIGLGTGAILVAGVMVGVATPKAMKLIEDAQVAKTKRFKQMREKAPDDAVMDETDELTWVEIIKAGWKPYAPAIMTAVVGVACIVGGTRANARRNAALSAAYTVVEQTLNDYTAKTKEIVGEKKEKEIRDAIAEDELKKHPLSGCNVVRMPKCGKTLCYDVRSREYFMSDYNTIKKVENDLNRRLRSEMFIEDNTRLNSLVSHELMTVNEKFKSTYNNRFKAFLFMGTNKPVKITDAKSGLIRRLIDVTPSGKKLSFEVYSNAMANIDFELGAITMEMSQSLAACMTSMLKLRCSLERVL